jgi:hypothetical protein
MICESNELLAGLKNLFADSDADEQVRLMTIAPKEWGRQKIEKKPFQKSGWILMDSPINNIM